MEVRLFPNSRRPGVGLKPRRESQRPLLPQHARHCPVLEAGSALGFLVYPPLEPHESFNIEFQGEGRYQFSYFLKTPQGKWQGLFALTIGLPVGSMGMIKEEVEFLVPDPPISREEALRVARTFIVPEDLGTPPGAISLRGSTNFQTPTGWDTVYTPIFNNIERPIAPMLIVRVETDWYSHETEFRYVLQPGESISAAHSLPIGQAFFVPREDITFRDCNEEELEAIKQSAATFSDKKAADTLTTAYGMKYSPHYLRESRSTKS
ncbi:MAG TPA: hypothetical protein VGY48_05450 [Vicinamibacterales bacterium]|jgi:hypothetical protein|nr:hypothetical protein [Vicinamibacterales bacterium]